MHRSYFGCLAVRISLEYPGACVPSSRPWEKGEASPAGFGRQDRAAFSHRLKSAMAGDPVHVPQTWYPQRAGSVTIG